jgi:ParB/RepB/Spo0J family partition protein
MQQNGQSRSGDRLPNDNTASAAPPNGDKQILRWEIAKLQPHPRQAGLFRPPPEHEVAELADDMKRNGQLQPVEILPDGVLIAGHKRVAAATLLGWAEVDVWVRDDLANDPVAAERRLIEDNLYRRQLGPLEVARCYKRLKEMGRKTDYRWDLARERKDLRDVIGERLEVSGRNLDRWLRVLDHTPQEVQDAVAAGSLPITVAEKVAGLSEEHREQIAKAIREGGKPQEVVQAAVAKPDGRHKNARDAVGAFLKSLQRGLADLDGRVQDVWISPRAMPTLQAGEALIKQLQEQVGEPTEDLAATMEALLEPGRDDPPDDRDSDQPDEPPDDIAADQPEEPPADSPDTGAGD